MSSPPFSVISALSPSNPDINTGCLLGEGSRSRETGKASTIFFWLYVGGLPGTRCPHIIWVPTLGLSHFYTSVQAWCESIIVHFMVMNGTAWQLSDYYFHSLPCNINLIPHYMPFFSCIPHASRTKKGNSHAQATASPKNKQILMETVEQQPQV